MLAYSTADNMDGKQARRTSSSSPLGFLFDHGLDAVNSGVLGWAIAAIHAQAGGSWHTFAMWAIPTVPFFYSTWEAYHTGCFVLPIVNGPNEGVLATVALLLLTAYLGPSGLWGAPHTALPLALWVLTPVVDLLRAMSSESTPASAALHSPVTNLDLLLACFLVGVGLTVAHQMWTVTQHEWRRGGGRAVGTAFARQAPFALLLLVVWAWTRNPACRVVAHDHWALFFGCAGILFVDMSFTTMLAHVTDSEVSMDARGLGAFAFCPLILALNILPERVDKVAFSAACLLISLTLATVLTGKFIVGAVSEICTLLDLSIFDISRNARPAGAHQASGGEPAPPPLLPAKAQADLDALVAALAPFLSGTTTTTMSGGDGGGASPPSPPASPSPTAVGTTTRSHTRAGSRSARKRA